MMKEELTTLKYHIDDLKGFQLSLSYLRGDPTAVAENGRMDGLNKDTMTR